MILDPKTTAFIFPGQGSQAVGMGSALAAEYPIAKELFDEADALFGYPFSKLMWDGPKEDLDDTVNTQPALYVHSMAAQRVFSHLYPVEQMNSLILPVYTSLVCNLLSCKV